MPRIIVTGCRRWWPWPLAERVMDRLTDRYSTMGIDIVHGAATGVDSVFRETARRFGVAEVGYPADWGRYGNEAGPIRNREMVAGGADFAIACHRSLGTSRGTGHCVRCLLGAGIPVYLLDSIDAEPVRIRRID